jgi:hypothetical protein
VEQTGSTAEKEEVAAVGQRGVDAEEEELVGAMSGDVGYQEVPCAEMLDIKRCHVRRCWISRLCSGETMYSWKRNIVVNEQTV